MGFMDIFKTAVGFIPGVGPVAKAGLDAAGAMAGGAAKNMANNRGAKLAASMDMDRIATERGAEDRAERDSAWKRLLNAQYVQNDQGYTPATLKSNHGFADRTLPSFGIARTGPYSDTMKQGAQGMEAEVMKRLTGGSQLRPLSDIEKLSKMGKWEKFLNFAAPGLNIAGAMANRGNGEYDPYAKDTTPIFTPDLG